MSDDFDDVMPDDDVEEARSMAKDDDGDTRNFSKSPFYFNLENEVTLTLSVPMLHALGQFILDHKEDAFESPYLLALAHQARKFGKSVRSRVS